MSKSLPKLQSSTQRYLQHPLNHSTSKMMYPFSRSQRFLNRVQNNGVPYYDKPSELSHRMTSIGYGKKTTFEDRRGYPPPNRYNISSQFQEGGKKRGISFGISREQVMNNSMFVKSTIPGPGAYNPKPLKQQPSYTMRRQVPDNSEDEKRKVPGPGQYDIVGLMNNKGRHGNSKYQGVKTIIIRKAIERVKTEVTPGPSSYLPQVLNAKGRKPIAESQASKFPQGKRIGIYEPNSNPGPGQQYLSV